MAGTLTIGLSDAVFADLGWGLVGFTLGTAVLLGLLLEDVGEGDLLGLSEIVILGTDLFRFAFILLMLLLMIAKSAERSLDFDGFIREGFEELVFVEEAPGLLDDTDLLGVGDSVCISFLSD